MVTTVRVYEYGLRDPILGAVRVDNQLLAAHRYRNKLVEIERERRAAVREVLSGHMDAQPIATDVLRLVDELEAARVRIKASRATTRARSDAPADRAAVRELAGRLKMRRAELKTAKTAVAADPVGRARLNALEEHSRARVREERGRCGVYWGTYLLVEEDADRARKGVMDPRFQRFTGEGRVSAQLQGGLDVADLWGGDARVQIDPVPASAHDPATPRGVRRTQNRTVVRLRIGSDAHRSPIWAAWPLVLHRPLPVGARIKRATIARRRVDCRRWEWRLQLIVDVTTRHAGRGRRRLEPGVGETDRGGARGVRRGGRRARARGPLTDVDLGSPRQGGVSAIDPRSGH